MPMRFFHDALRRKQKRMVPPRARGKTTTSRIEERQRYHHATMATTTRTRTLPMSASREAVKSATRRETFLFSSSFFVLLWRIFAVKKHVLLLNSRARKKLKKSKYHLASTQVPPSEYTRLHLHHSPVAIIGEIHHHSSISVDVSISSSVPTYPVNNHLFQGQTSSGDAFACGFVLHAS